MGVMKKVALWTGILFAIALAFISFLTLFQDSLIFFPRTTTDDRWKQLIEEELKADYVSIRADDDAVLEGMFLSDHTGAPRPTIIVFPGNAMRRKFSTPHPNILQLIPHTSPHGE